MNVIMNLRFPEWHLSYWVAEQLLACEFRGLRSGTVEVSVLLEWDVASLGEWFLNVSVCRSHFQGPKISTKKTLLQNPSSGMLRSASSQLLSTLRDSLSVASWTAWPLKTSVNNYQHKLLWITVERRLQLHHSGTPKSRKIFHCFGRSYTIDSVRRCHIAERQWPQFLVIKKPCTL